MRLLPLSVVLALSCRASAQPIHHVCPAAALGGCAEEWPRACWQGSAVTWRWSFAAASMAALLAQHRKLWRRRSSKGVSLAMVGLGCGAQVCEALAQLIARLHVRPRWHGWEWSDPALTPLVVQLLQAALWLGLLAHAVHWAPNRSLADVEARAESVRGLGFAAAGLAALLFLLWVMLALLGPCGLTVDLGCLLAALADGLVLLTWLPQLHLSAQTGSVGAITVPGSLVGGLGQCGAAMTLSGCAVAGSAWLAPLVSGLEQLALFALLLLLTHRHALARRSNWVGADARHGDGEAQGLLDSEDDTAPPSSAHAPTPSKHRGEEEEESAWYE